MITEDTVSSIERLHKLKDQGIITEAEFEQSKQRILFGGKAKERSPQPYDGTLPPTEDIISWLKLPLQRYAQFEGRSGRREFWLFQLLPAAVILVWLLVAGTATGTGLETMATVLAGLALLGMVVPQLALQARRFHDQDRSGWFVLLNLIPYIGFIIVAVMMLLEGTRGTNQFGPDPNAD